MQSTAHRFVHDPVHELAVDTDSSEDEVRRIYEHELAAADSDARVKAFVPVFAKRRTLARLKARGSHPPRR